MTKRAIGERIQTAYRVYVVALPDNNDEYIKISMLTPFCFSGTMYYEGNEAEDFNAFEMEKALRTPEWAKKFIPGYREGMKILTVPAFCSYSYSFDEKKVNDKRIDKLSRLTRWEFYNTKW